MNKRSIPIAYMQFLILCVVSLFPSLVSACLGAHADCTSSFSKCCEPFPCRVTGLLTGPYQTCSCATPGQSCGPGKSSDDKPGCCDGSRCGRDGKCPSGTAAVTGYSCPESVTIDGKSVAFSTKLILSHILNCFFGSSGNPACPYDTKTGQVQKLKKGTPIPSYCPTTVHYTCPTLEGRTFSSMNVYHDTNRFACWYKRPSETHSDSTGCTYNLTNGKLLHGYSICPPTVPR